MKNKILKTLITLAITSFAFSATIQPTISLRYNDVVETNNDLASLDTDLVAGIAMSLGDGVKAGFDSDGSDSRIYVSFDYGTMGMGMNNRGEPQFTVGANYDILSNITVSLDYVINNLGFVWDEGVAEDPDDDVATDVTLGNQLRMSIGISF